MEGHATKTSLTLLSWGPCECKKSCSNHMADCPRWWPLPCKVQELCSLVACFQVAHHAVGLMIDVLFRLECPQGYRLVPIEFEKDDEHNYHVEFVAAASSLRGRNYGIPSTDKLQVCSFVAR